MIDSMHTNTAGLHYEGPGISRRQIIIDAAEIRPGVFEIMAMRADGTEFDVAMAGSISEAERIYSRMLLKHTRPDPLPASDPTPAPAPLSGKYAKLRDDLMIALQAGRDAEAADPDDGGACNFDSAAIYLPRWNAALIQRAASEAGTGCFDYRSPVGRAWVFSPDTRGQANARSRNAEAMTRALKSMGYSAFDYCRMD